MNISLPTSEYLQIHTEVESFPDPVEMSISPRPISWSAPDPSKMVLESIFGEYTILAESWL